MIPLHQLTKREADAVDALSNKIYDTLGDKLTISDKRRDEMTRAACDAMRRFLEAGA